MNHLQLLCILLPALFSGSRHGVTAFRAPSNGSRSPSTSLNDDRHDCPRSGCHLCKVESIHATCWSFCRFCEKRTLTLAFKNSKTLDDLDALPGDVSSCPTRNCTLCNVVPQLRVYCPKFCRSCEIRSLAKFTIARPKTVSEIVPPTTPPLIPLRENARSDDASRGAKSGESDTGLSKRRGPTRLAGNDRNITRKPTKRLRSNSTSFSPRSKIRPIQNDTASSKRPVPSPTADVRTVKATAATSSKRLRHATSSGASPAAPTSARAPPANKGANEKCPLSDINCKGFDDDSGPVNVIRLPGLRSATSRSPLSGNRVEGDRQTGDRQTPSTCPYTFCSSCRVQQVPNSCALFCKRCNTHSQSIITLKPLSRTSSKQQLAVTSRPVSELE